MRDPRYGAHDGAQLRRVAARVRRAPTTPTCDGTAERVRAGGRAPAARGAGRPPRPGGAGARRGGQVPPPPPAARPAAPGRRDAHGDQAVLGDEPAGGRVGAAAGPLVRRGDLRRGLADPAGAGRLGDLARPTRSSSPVTSGSCRRPASSPPPSTTRGSRTDDDALTEGFESVLDVLTAALPTRRLSWHYRSLDERLVAFANEQMYDGSLVTFPGTGTDAGACASSRSTAPASVAAGRGGHRVDRGRGRPGRRARARARPHPAARVARRHRPRHQARHPDRRGRCAGRCADAPTGVGDFFDEDRPERFFVKNLERVQGDERDAIILSIGYGKTPHGRVLHRFGPLNLEGGERRLNVAITRARRRMTVVSSLLAADLDPARLKARGAVMLRDFLAYAADGRPSRRRVADEAGRERVATRPAARPPARPSCRTGTAGRRGDPLRADFARRLREAGLVVHEAYGSAGHPHRPRGRGPAPPAARCSSPSRPTGPATPRCPAPATATGCASSSWQARVAARARVDDRPVPRPGPRRRPGARRGPAARVRRRSVEASAPAPSPDASPTGQRAEARRPSPQPQAVAEEHRPTPARGDRSTAEGTATSGTAERGADGRPSAEPAAPTGRATEAPKRPARANAGPRSCQPEQTTRRHRRRLGRAHRRPGPRPMAARAAAPALGHRLTAATQRDEQKAPAPPGSAPSCACCGADRRYAVPRWCRSGRTASGVADLAQQHDALVGAASLLVPWRSVP